MRLPKGIAALGPEVAQRVETLVADAAARQEQEFAEALATALRIVPRPLRGAVRRVMGA